MGSHIIKGFLLRYGVLVVILASMFGLPDTCVSLVTPIMIVLDFFNTSARCGDIVTQTVISAVDMDELDR